MLVPLNLKKASNLCLSIIKVQNKYSVAVMSIVNGWGMVALPSYMCDCKDELDENQNLIDACACMEDWDPVSGPDLYKCISEILDRLKEDGYY